MNRKALVVVVVLTLGVFAQQPARAQEMYAPFWGQPYTEANAYADASLVWGCVEGALLGSQVIREHLLGIPDPSSPEYFVGLLGCAILTTPYMPANFSRWSSYLSPSTIALLEDAYDLAILGDSAWDVTIALLGLLDSNSLAEATEAAAPSIDTLSSDALQRAELMIQQAEADIFYQIGMPLLYNANSNSGGLTLSFFTGGSSYGTHIQSDQGGWEFTTTTNTGALVIAQ